MVLHAVQPRHRRCTTGLLSNADRCEMLTQAEQGQALAASAQAPLLTAWKCKIGLKVEHVQPALYLAIHDGAQ